MENSEKKFLGKSSSLPASTNFGTWLRPGHPQRNEFLVLLTCLQILYYRIKHLHPLQGVPSLHSTPYLKPRFAPYAIVTFIGGWGHQRGVNGPRNLTLHTGNLVKRHRWIALSLVERPEFEVWSWVRGWHTLQWI